MKKVAILLVASLMTIASPASSFAENYTHSTSSVIKGYQEFYNEKNGFIPIQQAVNKFESRYNKKVELPTRFPFPIMLQTAKLTTSPDQTHSVLKLYYLGPNSGDSLIIQIDNVPIGDTQVAKEVVALKDGTKAYVRRHRHYYLFEFEKHDGFKYMFGIFKKTQAPISTETLLQIANSMTSDLPFN